MDDIFKDSPDDDRMSGGASASIKGKRARQASPAGVDAERGAGFGAGAAGSLGAGPGAGAASGASTDLLIHRGIENAMVKQMSKLLVAEAQLSLSNAKVVRDIKGLLNTSTIILAASPAVAAIRAAAAAYEKATFKKPGHGQGSPDMWCCRAMLLCMVKLLPPGDQLNALQSQLTTLQNPFSYKDVVGVCRCRECFKEDIGHRLDLCTGPLGKPIENIICKFFATDKACEIKVGVAPRSGVERTVAAEMGKFQDIFQKYNNKESKS